MAVKVLQLCKKSPTPQRDGESVAIHQTTKLLQALGASIDVLAMLTPKHPHKSEHDELPDVSYQYVRIKTNLNPIQALLSTLGVLPYPLIIERFRSSKFEDVLISLFEENTYDYIVMEGIFLTAYLPIIKKYSKATLVLRAHNVEHLIWQRVADEQSNGLKRWFYGKLIAVPLNKFEMQMLQEFKGIISISPIDNQYFIKQHCKQTYVLPVCVETSELPHPLVSKQIAYIGSLDWKPNLDGIQWFIQSVWTELYKRNPSWTFHIAGRNIPKEIKDLKEPGIIVHGEVSDAKEFILQQEIMIAPIFSGSGMRVKIIEAMSMGKCVVSTQVGAEGIDCLNGRDIFLEETALAWQQCLHNLMQHTDLRNQTGANALELINRHYDLSLYEKSFKTFIESL